MPTQSSGFNKPPPELPPGIPKRVTVQIFGPAPLGSQAANEFAAGLMSLGFEVVTSQPDGVFEGSVSAEQSRTWTDTHLNLRLMKDNKAIWSVQAHDPRTFGWSMAPETSIIYTTRAALDALRKDLGQKAPPAKIAHGPK